MLSPSGRKHKHLTEVHLRIISTHRFWWRNQCAGERVVASPYARKLAAEAGVDIADATPTGTNGRVVAADVQELISGGGGGTPPPPPPRRTRSPPSPHRRAACRSWIYQTLPGDGAQRPGNVGVHRAASDDSSSACACPGAASGGLPCQLAAGIPLSSDTTDDWTPVL